MTASICGFEAPSTNFCLFHSASGDEWFIVAAFPGGVEGLGGECWGVLPCTVGVALVVVVVGCAVFDDGVEEVDDDEKGEKSCLK